MHRTLQFIAFSALLAAALLPLARAEVVTKNGGDNSLSESLATGGKTFTVSATGTLEWVSGATLTGASLFRASAGLAIGTDVQAYDADLTTWAGITPSANVQTLLATADYAAFRTQLGLGTLAVQNFDNVAISGGGISGLAVFSILNSGTGVHNFQINHIGTMTGSHTLTFNLNNSERAIALSGNLTVSADATLSGTNTGDQTLTSLLPSQTGHAGEYLTTNGTTVSWGAISTGITIGTTSISGGTSGRLLTSGATVGELTLGAGVSPALGNAVDGASGLLTYGMIGTSGAKLPLLNAANTFSAAQVVNVASGSFLTCKLSGTDFTYIKDDGLYLGMPGVSGWQVKLVANWGAFGIYSNAISYNYGLHYRATGGSGEIEYFNLWDTGTANQMDLRNGTAAQVLRVTNTYSSSTSWEGFDIDWQTNPNVCRLGPKAGSGGGTVRPAEYGTRLNVFWSSGSGSPEGVVTAAVGSLYTRTDGGAGTTLYVKESGTGNTGWVAK